MRDLTPHELLAAERPIAGRPVLDRGRCVLLFPNTYHVGMSSLSLHTVWSMLNDRGLICERAFLPDEGLGAGVRSLESGTPLGGFEFLLITSSFELDWLNIPRLMEAGGVPPLREDRDETHPLVIAGGPAVTSNPEPLADLVDIAWLGEIEPLVAPFITISEAADSKEDVIEGLLAAAREGGGLSGIYVPSRPEHGPELAAGRERVKRLYAPDLSGFSTESAVVTPHTAFADRFLIELGRGCGRTCTFCLARQIYRPVRVREPGHLLERIEQALPVTNRVGLVATAVSDYPHTEELFGALIECGADVSVSSVRAESVTGDLLEALGRSGQDMLTLAPEAGTEALRAKLGKAMADDDLVRCLRLGVAAGLTRYKLYFLLGAPGETEADAMSMVGLVERLRAEVPDAYISVSVSPFVPKPHTPLAHSAALPEAQLRRRINQVADALRKSGVHDLTTGSARWGAVQAVLSRGGRELGRAIVEASRAGGGYGELKSAVKRHGRKWREYLGPQEFGDGQAPWDVVSCSERGDE